MVQLYLKVGCPFCNKVVDTIQDEIGVPFQAQFIHDDNVAQELVDRGGKRQVPYLVDERNKVEMYESDDIISYLRNQYA
jgi:glutaredoxin